MSQIRKTAKKILHEYNLLNELNKIGKSFIVGSYAMDAMSHNDIDIDVCNRNMNIKKLHELTQFILTTFIPIWYEAKQETTTDGSVVWFHGFESILYGELWNFDIWFFNQETIDEAVKFSTHIKTQLERNIDKKNYIINIKNDLINKGLYSFDKYTSIDVYKAVLDLGITTTEQFLSNYTK